MRIAIGLAVTALRQLLGGGGAPANPSLLLEDGARLLLEDGSYLLLEA